MTGRDDTGVLLVFQAGLLGVLAFTLSSGWLTPAGRFWLFGAAFALVALLAVRADRRDRELDVFAPLLPSIVLLYLYVSSSALYATETGTTLYGDPVGRDVMRTFYLASLVGLTGLSVGYLLGRSRPASLPGWLRIDPSFTDADFLRQLRWMVPALGLLCLPWVLEAFDFVRVRPYAETALEGRLLKREQGSGQPLAEVFLQQVPLVLLMALGILLVFRSRRASWKIVGAGLVGAHAATALLGGQRGVLMMAGTVVLVFVHYRVHRLRGWTLAGVFASGYLVVNALSFVRLTSDPAEMLSLLRTAWEGGDLRFLALSQSGEFAVGQNLMRLISAIQDGQVGFTWGSSVVTELLVFVPRAVLPSRPLPLAEQFVEVFYPGIREIGGGYGFFYLMEGYWALGLPGVFLFMTAFGWSVSVVYRAFTEGRMTDFQALWYAYALYALVLSSVRTGIIGAFKAALLASIPFLLVLGVRRLSAARARPVPEASG